MVLAHASHWLVNLAYIVPVVGFLIWLGFATLKERRAAAVEDGDGMRGRDSGGASQRGGR